MLDAWKDFFVATAGAAAALTGLLFIAVSLRPSEIRRSFGISDHDTPA